MPKTRVLPSSAKCGILTGPLPVGHMIAAGVVRIPSGIIDTMIDLTIIPSSQETDKCFTFDVTHLNLEHYEMENLNYLLKQRNELKKIEMICDENSFLQSLTIDKNKTSLNNVEFENLIHAIISQILYDREELAKHYKKEQQEEEESNT